MGIDVYCRWPEQTEAEKDKQFTGFSVTSGDVGYLREAYHGGPYVTRYLVGEAFEAEECEAAIPAKVLRDRLPNAALLAIYREHVVYGEAAKAPGIIDLDQASDPGAALLTSMRSVFGADGTIETMKTGRDEKAIVEKITDEQRDAISTLIAKRDLPDTVLTFVDFVDLCARKEGETGKPCTIIASY